MTNKYVVTRNDTPTPVIPAALRQKRINSGDPASGNATKFLTTKITKPLRYTKRKVLVHAIQNQVNMDYPHKAGNDEQLFGHNNEK